MLSCREAKREEQDESKSQAVYYWVHDVERQLKDVFRRSGGSKIAQKEPVRASSLEIGGVKKGRTGEKAEMRAKGHGRARHATDSSSTRRERRSAACAHTHTHTHAHEGVPAGSARHEILAYDAVVTLLLLS